MSKSDLIGDYVALLIYLNKNFEPFRKAYSTKSWRALCFFLTSDSDQIAKVCLCGLCALYDIIPKSAQKGGFPTHDVAELLKNPNTKGAAIPLLLRTQPRLSEGKSQEQKQIERQDMTELLSSLFEVAHSDKKATLVLMEMANDENVAALMVAQPKWIGDELPTTIETVRLFAVVLAHKDLRPALMKSDIVISLFSNMISQDDPSICSIICTFVRRLPITDKFVQSLGKQGLIKSYIELFLKSEDPNVTMSGLLFVDSVESLLKAMETSVPYFLLVSADLFKASGMFYPSEDSTSKDIFLQALRLMPGFATYSLPYGIAIEVRIGEKEKNETYSIMDQLENILCTGDFPGAVKSKASNNQVKFVEIKKF